MASIDNSSPPPPSSSSSSPPLIVCPMQPANSFLSRIWRKKPHHLSPFDWSTTKLEEKKALQCNNCKLKTIFPMDYWCEKCNVAFHKECVHFSRIIKVPYHPKHRLHLISDKDVWFTKSCNDCGEDTEGYSYFCSICDFNLHIVCAKKNNILSINYPKRHDHTLTYFPRKNSLTCDVCALVNDKSLIYTCDQCDFVVHKSCIYLPITIRISRHDHRLSFTPCLSISSKDDTCGICHKNVDKNYGLYSCVKECNYVVHCKCATQSEFWDGKELQGEPETEQGNIILKTFEEKGDGVIEHFSHPDHHMKLEKKEDDEKRCQACMLPINEGNIYSCMKCDYILHATCAYLPRVKVHQLHAHPLTLQVDHEGGDFTCKACGFCCCGFAYACREPSCTFILDVRCSLVSEPFVNELHPHPLFFTTEEEEGKWNECDICRDESQLTCIKCSFDLCWSCATFPNKLKCRYDEHYLTFSYNNEEGDEDHIWCEICEEKTYSNVGFYTCNVCGVTLHNVCILGRDPYMNHGQRFKYINATYDVIPNDRRLTRPICSRCGKHSPYRIAYISSFGMLFCSIRCIEKRREKMINGYWKMKR